MPELVEAVLSDIVAGLIGTALISGVVMLWARVGPERGRAWLRALAWPLATFGFFALTASVAIVRNATGTLAVGLGLLVGAATALFVLFRFGPERARAAGRALRGRGWPVLTGACILACLYLVLFDTGGLGAPEPVVLVADLAPEEMMALSRLLDELRPTLGHEVRLQPVPRDRQLDRLRAMIERGATPWDVIALDHTEVAAAIESGLLEDLGSLALGVDEDDAGAVPLVPALHQVLAAPGDGRTWVAPFRVNVKVGFYRRPAFADRAPPGSLAEVAELAGARQADASGRLALQVVPDRAAAVTLIEAVGGDPRRLSRQALGGALADLRRLGPALHPDGERALYDVLNELLIDGQLDLACNWSYGYRKVVEEAGCTDIGVYPGWQSTHVLGGEVLVVPRGAPQPGRSLRLIRLLGERRIQRALAERLRWVPARLDAHDALPDELADAVRGALARTIVRPVDPAWTTTESTLARVLRAAMDPRGPDLDALIAACRDGIPLAAARSAD